MKETINIKLYDNEEYDYPIIKIHEEGFENFKKDLDEYRKNKEYNIDDFIRLVEGKSYFVEVIHTNREVYF